MTTTTTNTSTNKPAAKLRDGRMTATIWANPGEKGTFYSVDFTRSYQDARGDWQESRSFSGSELLRLAHLAGQAYDELARLRSTDDEGDLDQ